MIFRMYCGYYDILIKLLIVIGEDYNIVRKDMCELCFRKCF